MKRVVKISELFLKKFLNFFFFNFLLIKKKKF
jgi:hypothetical protein